MSPTDAMSFLLLEILVQLTDEWGVWILFKQAQILEDPLQLLANLVFIFCVEIWPGLFQGGSFDQLHVDTRLSLLSTPAVYFWNGHTGKQVSNRP
jgi:hypothetical protein